MTTLIMAAKETTCQVVLKNTFCFNFRDQETFDLYQEKEVTAIFPLLPY